MRARQRPKSERRRRERNLDLRIATFASSQGIALPRGVSKRYRSAHRHEEKKWRLDFARAASVERFRTRRIRSALCLPAESAGPSRVDTSAPNFFDSGSGCVR